MGCLNMGRGEIDYEIWSADEFYPHGLVKLLATCDTRANVILKLARMNWPADGLVIVPVRRKKHGL
jgi:hypothetical protein